MGYLTLETKVRFMAVGDNIVLKALLTATCRGTMQRERVVSSPFLTATRMPCIILEPVL